MFIPHPIIQDQQVGVRQGMQQGRIRSFLASLALDRLQGLNEEVRSAMVTDESGELWSARKVFRRFVENEREHTAHIREIMEQYETRVLNK